MSYIGLRARWPAKRQWRHLVTKLLGKLVRRFISHATLSLWLLRPLVFPQILFRPLPTKASESRNAFSQIQSSSFLLRINCTLNPKSASLCCFQIVHSVLHCCTLRLFSNHSQRFVPWGCKLLAGAPGHLKGSTHGWCLESCECVCIKWIFWDEWSIILMFHCWSSCWCWCWCWWWCVYIKWASLDEWSNILMFRRWC